MVDKDTNYITAVAVEVQKLDLSENDLLIVKIPTEMFTTVRLERLSAMITKFTNRRPLIINSDIELSTISIAQLEGAGLDKYVKRIVADEISKLNLDQQHPS